MVVRLPGAARAPHRSLNAPAAQGLRDGFAARGALHEDFLHRQSLAQSAGLAVDALGARAGRAPEMLGETLSGLDDIAAAHAGVLEPDAADGLRREGRIMLAAAAAEGLISRDPDGTLAALEGGAAQGRAGRGPRHRGTARRGGSGR